MGPQRAYAYYIVYMDVHIQYISKPAQKNCQVLTKINTEVFRLMVIGRFELTQRPNYFIQKRLG